MRPVPGLRRRQADGRADPRRASASAPAEARARPSMASVPHTAEPGTRLAGRYRLVGLTGGDHARGPMRHAPGATSAAALDTTTAVWHAFDELLVRPVSVRLLAAGAPVAETVLAVARRAATFEDPRFLAVLDAGTDEQHAYVVSEWTGADSLVTLLDRGPLPAPEAQRIVAEVADALAHAHDAGLAHRCLRPESVLRTDGGRVRVAGLGVDAVLAGIDPWAGPAAVAEDLQGAGAVLYTALTARWPLPPRPGQVTVVPPAPRDVGEPCSPRQVRAGVPADLDEVTCRALGGRRRRGAAPLGSSRELADLLTAGGSAGSTAARVTDGSGSVPGAGDEVPLLAAPVDGVPALRTGLVVAAAALTLGISLLGWQMVQSAEQAPEPAATAAAAGEPDPLPDVLPVPLPTRASALVPVERAVDFDPQGDGRENPRRVDRALDGDVGTVWTTQEYYNSPFGGLKEGVGLVLDLGEVRTVGNVALGLHGSGSDLKLGVSAEPGDDVPDDLEDFEMVADVQRAGSTAVLEPDEPVEARYVLVWFTALPPSSEARWRGGISTVQVRS